MSSRSCLFSKKKMEVAAFEKIGGPPVSRIIRDDYHRLTLFNLSTRSQDKFPRSQNSFRTANRSLSFGTQLFT